MKALSGNIALFILLPALLLAGCRQAERPASAAEEVGFLVTASQGPASKATLYSGALAAT